MRRRSGLCVASVMLLGFVGVACTGSDQGAPSTSPPSETVELETIPSVREVVTTGDSTGSGADSLPSTTVVEPAIVTIDDQIRAAGDAFGFAAPSVADFAGLPLTDIAVSPSGRWIAINRETEICLLDTSTGSVSPVDGCVEFAGFVAPGSLAWSPDESTVAFHGDWARRQQESDIVVLDVASRSLTVLTDDGTDDLEAGELDVAPFYGEDGTLHFFRADPDLLSFTVTEFGDPPITLDHLVVQGFPNSARRDPVGGAVVVEVLEAGQPFPSIVTIDLAEGTSTPIEADIDAINRFPILDVADGRALIGQGPLPEVNGTRAALVDLSDAVLPQSVPSAPAGADRPVVGVGLSPDGTAVMMIIADLTDPIGHQLVVAPILDDGSVGPLGVIATGEDFAPNNGDKTVRPRGLGWQREIVWTPDQIVFGLGPNQLVTLDLDS